MEHQKIQQSDWVQSTWAKTRSVTSNTNMCQLEAACFYLSQISFTTLTSGTAYTVFSMVSLVSGGQTWINKYVVIFFNLYFSLQALTDDFYYSAFLSHFSWYYIKSKFYQNNWILTHKLDLAWHSNLISRQSM